jgi:glycosyltransferase involved in cell wall biosynthesis
MRIAHVLSSFGMGGQERVAVDLARAQRAAGHDVMAVSLAPPPPGPHEKTFRDAGVETRTVAKGAGFDPGLALRLARTFKAERIDVVHTHNPQPLIYGAPAGRLAGAAVIHTKHGRNPDLARRRWLRRAAAELVDAYVAVSPDTALVARRNRDCDPKRLQVIQNGIDVEAFVPDPGARALVRSELGIPPGAWVVGTIGRLAKEKDHVSLVRAVEPLLSHERRLVIVGDGPERDALHELVGSIERGRFVHLTGARSDPARLLASFDVFAMSSQTEGLPLVLLEAMAAGLPVVSTDVGGIGDVVEHGRTGFLVRRGELARFAAELLRLNEEPALGREMGAAAVHVVREKHALAQMADTYLALYADALARRASAAGRLRSYPQPAASPAGAWLP